MASIDEKNKLIDDNIDKLDEVISDTLEKRIFHICEKAENNIDCKENEYRDYFDKISCEEKDKHFCIEENKRYVNAVQNSIKTYDTLLVAELYCKGYEVDFPQTIDDRSVLSNVVYLKNPLTDIAYRNFSKVLKNARVDYEDSFISVCESVYYNRAQYCILPIENYEDGRLSGFMNMIRKYDLKIVMTCNVESANGKITKFSLLKRELTRIHCDDTVNKGEYLEIGFNFGENSRLHEILGAAMFFGYNLDKVDSLPVYYSEKEYYYDVVFSGSGQLQKFLYWLDLEFPRYEILGIYTQI